MRIRMTQTLSGERDVFLKDKECDLDDAEAQSFIRAGIAVPVDGAPANPPARRPGRPPASESAKS